MKNQTIGFCVLVSASHHFYKGVSTSTRIAGAISSRVALFLGQVTGKLHHPAEIDFL